MGVRAEDATVHAGASARHVQKRKNPATFLEGGNLRAACILRLWHDDPFDEVLVLTLHEMQTPLTARTFLETGYAILLPQQFFQALGNKEHTEDWPPPLGVECWAILAKEGMPRIRNG